MNTATEYLDPTGPEMHQRIERDLCAWCGSTLANDGCFCRRCDSCSQFWLADGRRDYDDGRPAVQACPDCEPRCLDCGQTPEEGACIYCKMD